MARYLNGIHGPFIGTVGSIVGSTYNGKPYMKSRPDKRTTVVSAKELANRQKFAVAQAWLRPLTAL
jgi:hypothetical protein